MEYAQSLNFSLCFQGFDKELAELPGNYAPPSGRLLLAEYDGTIAGCVALRALDATTCEMKRLFVRPQFRGAKIGKALTIKIIEEGHTIGYTRMVLDTVEETMQSASQLYKKLGFTIIPPYYDNQACSSVCMELILNTTSISL